MHFKRTPRRVGRSHIWHGWMHGYGCVHTKKTNVAPYLQNNNIEEAMAGASIDSVKVADDGTDLKMMTEQIGLLATKFDISLASLETKFDTSLASLETRFDTQAASLASLATKFDTSLTSLETRFDAHDAALASLTGQMADCMDRLAGVEERYERFHNA